MSAAADGHDAMVRLLLQSGAEVNATDEVMRRHSLGGAAHTRRRSDRGSYKGVFSPIPRGLDLCPK